MTENENLIARIGALEFLCQAFLVLYLSNVRNDDANFSKSKALIDMLQDDGEASLAHLSPEMWAHGAAVLKDILNRVRQNLAAFHGGPAVQSH